MCETDQTILELAYEFDIDIFDLIYQYNLSVIDCLNSDQDISKFGKEHIASTVKSTLVDNMATQRRNPVISKHKIFSFYWHKESKFIFDPASKKVIGIFDENKKQELNDHDRKICRQYGFKILDEF